MLWTLIYCLNWFLSCVQRYRDFTHKMVSKTNNWTKNSCFISSEPCFVFGGWRFFHIPCKTRAVSRDKYSQFQQQYRRTHERTLNLVCNISSQDGIYLCQVWLKSIHRHGRYGLDTIWDGQTDFYIPSITRFTLTFNSIIM